jgi:hypothetical protein
MSDDDSGLYVTCFQCQREILSALFGAHLRRHNGLDWFSRRRPVSQRKPGSGSRSRDTSEGRRAVHQRWKDDRR